MGEHFAVEGIVPKGPTADVEVGRLVDVHACVLGDGDIVDESHAAEIEGVIVEKAAEGDGGGTVGDFVFIPTGGDFEVFGSEVAV